jgi:multimeric flavodoxin WrbA
MKFYLVNSSPRKKYNTSQLLDKVAEGIKDTLKDKVADVQIEKIYLYDLNYTGCRSCFLCKQKEGPFYGTCPVNDDIKDILADMRTCDGIVLGAPVYFADINGMLRSFVERLCFPQFPYAELDITEKRMPIGIIYDMNLPKDNPAIPFYTTVFDFLEENS